MLFITFIDKVHIGGAAVRSSAVSCGMDNGAVLDYEFDILADVAYGLGGIRSECAEHHGGICVEPFCRERLIGEIADSRYSTLPG